MTRLSATLPSKALSRSGLEVTRIGFGTAPIGGLYRACSDEEAREVLEAAYAAGIRYFDTAPLYGFGRAETRVGDFLASLPRDDCVVSTKVGRVLESVEPWDVPDRGYVDPLPFAPVFDYSHDGILRSYESSLSRLGGHRPEILYVHDIGPFTHGADDERHYRALIDGGLKALDELKTSGDVKAVGFGVNEVEVCERVLRDADIDIILLAGRYSLLDRAAEAGLLQTCAERKVDIVAGGVFNSGILATGPKPGAHFNYELASEAVLHKVRQLQAVCEDNGVPLATAALQFPLRSDVVACALLGTAKTGSLQRNLEGLAQPVPDALWPAADAVARG